MALAKHMPRRCDDLITTDNSSVAHLWVWSGKHWKLVGRSAQPCNAQSRSSSLASMMLPPLHQSRAPNVSTPTRDDFRHCILQLEQKLKLLRWHGPHGLHAENQRAPAHFIASTLVERHLNIDLFLLPSAWDPHSFEYYLRTPVTRHTCRFLITLKQP